MNGLSDVSIAQKMTGAGYLSRVGREFFPDPWLDYASLEMPRSLTNVLQWCEFLHLTNGVYRMACERVVRYFLTKIEIQDVDDDDADDYTDFLENNLKVMEILATLGDDFLCYGNSFSSMVAPFDRFLACKHCHLERPIDRCEYEFTAKFEFKGKCPRCGRTDLFDRHDRRSAKSDEFRIIRWSPHFMLLQANEMTHDIEYRYRFPADIKVRVKGGDKFYLRTMPWEMMEAIRDDKLFRFNPDQIYHMKEPTLAGIRTMGWGIPRMISNFRQAYYVQVLHRYNESLALDYIVPFRVLTPPPQGAAAADPFLHQNLGMSKVQILDMLAEHRRDPATYHFLPFPIQYQALGGEGVQMATFELINAGNDELLNGMGVPADFYKGTLQLQAAPTALRLFQQTWVQLPAAYNGWLNWLIRLIARIKNWEPAKARMQPVTLADDLEKKQILLQLVAAKEISKATAYGPFGIDVREELRRIYDEERQRADEEKKFQQEEQKRMEMEEQLRSLEANAAPQAAMGMTPPAAQGAPAGAPSPMGAGTSMPASPMSQPLGGGGMTPQAMMMQADQLAQQLVQMPYEQRKSQMLKLKQTDEALHAIVKSKMEGLRRDAGNQGKAQLQMQGQPGMG